MRRIIPICEMSDLIMINVLWYKISKPSFVQNIFACAKPVKTAIACTENVSHDLGIEHNKTVSVSTSSHMFGNTAIGLSRTYKNRFVFISDFAVINIDGAIL